MVLLSDNDIVFELARSNLLGEFLTIVNCPPNQIWVLPTLFHVARKRLKDDSAAQAALEAFRPNVLSIPAASAGAIVLFDGLDVGEQQMFAVLVDHGGTTELVTGDKRALSAVASIASNASPVATAIANRVYCLELLMLRLIRQHGFALVNSRVTAGTSKNVAIEVCFGAHRTQAEAEAYLKGYLNELTGTCSFLLKDQMPVEGTAR